jgi:hypothetical protein
MKHELRHMAATAAAQSPPPPDRGVGFPLLAHYIGAEHGVLGLTQAAAIECHPASVGNWRSAPG